MEEMARLAGLERAPSGLVDGYQDRIDFLSSLLAWMKRQPPVQLDKLIVWEERAMKLRLKKFQFPDLRLDAETGEIESRIKLNWRLFYKSPARKHEPESGFGPGNQLEDAERLLPSAPVSFSGERLNPRNLRVLRLEYPIIVSEEMRADPTPGIEASVERFGKVIDSLYQILREVFFSPGE